MTKVVTVFFVLFLIVTACDEGIENIPDTYTATDVKEEVIPPVCERPNLLIVEYTGPDRFYWERARVPSGVTDLQVLRWRMEATRGYVPIFGIVVQVEGDDAAESANYQSSLTLRIEWSTYDWDSQTTEVMNLESTLDENGMATFMLDTPIRLSEHESDGMELYVDFNHDFDGRIQPTIMEVITSFDVCTEGEFPLRGPAYTLVPEKLGTLTVSDRPDRPTAHVQVGDPNAVIGRIILEASYNELKYSDIVFEKDEAFTRLKNIRFLDVNTHEELCITLPDFSIETFEVLGIGITGYCDFHLYDSETVELEVVADLSEARVGDDYHLSLLSLKKDFGIFPANVDNQLVGTTVTVLPAAP